MAEFTTREVWYSTVKQIIKYHQNHSTFSKLIVGLRRQENVNVKHCTEIKPEYSMVKNIDS